MAEKLKFYDMKDKKSFETSNWVGKRNKKGVVMAHTKAPSGIKAVATIPKKE